MKVPILRIPFREEDKKFINSRISEVLDSGILTGGKYTKEFEKLFSKFVGYEYAIATNSCTSALEIIIRALEIEGKAIIVPTNTFLATALAVIHSGNRVIFADSNPKTFCLDPKDVEKRITNDTAAVILVHIGGIITPEYYELKELCDRKGLYLIEDCAHAHGSSIDGKKAGTLGIAGAFSFFPTKPLTTGEGGMITTNDEEIYERAMIIRNHGKDPKKQGQITHIGHNFRISELTAVLGVQQLLNAERILSERRKIAKLYDELLSNVENVSPIEIPKNVVSSYYKYIVYISEKYQPKEVKKIMKEKYKVSLAGEVYDRLCHEEPLWRRYTYCGKLRGENINCNLWPKCGCGKIQEDFPGAIYLSRHHICLPLYPGLKTSEAQYVVESLDKVLNSELRKTRKVG